MDKNAALKVLFCTQRYFESAKVTRRMLIENLLALLVPVDDAISFTDKRITPLIGSHIYTLGNLFCVFQYGPRCAYTY